MKLALFGLLVACAPPAPARAAAIAACCPWNLHAADMDMHVVPGDSHTVAIITSRTPRSIRRIKTHTCFAACGRHAGLCDQEIIAGPLELASPLVVDLPAPRVPESMRDERCVVASTDVRVIFPDGTFACEPAASWVVTTE